MLRHPLTLMTHEVRPLSLRPGATWLLVQDLHAPFASVDGALVEWPSQSPQPGVRRLPRGSAPDRAEPGAIACGGARS